MNEHDERDRALALQGMVEEPTNPHYALRLVEIEMRAEHFGAALEYAEAAIRIWHANERPKEPYVPYMFSVAMVLAGKTGKPQRILELWPYVPQEMQAAEHAHLVGCAYGELGQMVPAENFLRQARDDVTLSRGPGGFPAMYQWECLEALSGLYATMAKKARGND